MSSIAPESWPDDAVEVGAIVDAYGLKGWVKVAPYAQHSSGNALLSAKRWWLAQGRERWPVECVAARAHGEGVVAQVAGAADRDAALQLRGAHVYLSRADFPVLGNDEFYWVDLIGLEVVNEAGVPLGQVAGMIDNGAHSVLRVGERGEPAARERLIPFVDAYVKAVDQANQRIIVDWQPDY